MNITYLNILFSLCFGDHITCNQDSFSINKKYAVTVYNKPKEEVGYIYYYELHYDSTLITFKVERKNKIDDFIGF